jgi:hypothetical protein
MPENHGAISPSANLAPSRMGSMRNAAVVVVAEAVATEIVVLANRR